MTKLANKIQKRLQRQKRVRSIINGTAARPRLSVHISNTHISAQLIDDVNHNTLVAVSTVGQKDAKGSMTERAQWVGEQVAVKAKTAKIKFVVFDRGGKLYHGRVAALADAARKAGLEF